ncbi:MAG: dihydroorotate dehydrogenase-like protein [Planctomycetaceae bacterium]|nr:dihydroorotate dehydrogenase-like protein [Planctomycetales bacterium]MCB9921638.1 dihydroorotate dehydrogenase-like protein [Planctomycetaceae bacterium]
MSVDLSTYYLGMKLKNPLGVAACPPLTGNLDMLQRLEEAGASVAVLPSLFEEQIEHDELEFNRLFEYQSESFAEALTHFPELQNYNTGPRDYLRHIEAAKQTVGMPIIGSLNGASTGGWIRYARMIEEAGADALELNIYFVPTDADMTSAEVERRYVDLVGEVRQSVALPLAVKIGPNFTSLPNFAQHLVAAGADGLVLFNRYVEADIDLDTLQMKPDLVLSNRHEARVPIRWIAILRDQLQSSLAATSGVHRMQGALKLLLAGADVTMMASILLMKGPPILATILAELTAWLEENDYKSVEQMKGSMSRGNCPDPSALERANYMKALTNYTMEHPLPPSV